MNNDKREQSRADVRRMMPLQLLARCWVYRSEGATRLTRLDKACFVWRVWVGYTEGKR